MTDADLNRIETRLGIALPLPYRELMRTRAEELRGLTNEIRGVTHCWFDELLYLDADEVIEVNLSEQQPDAGTEYAFPNWSETFFLIGTNGAGDYYCLRLNGDRKVWMIGSDCGDEPSEMYDSLTEFVDEEVRRHAEENTRQPPPVLSSFDGWCPLAERFAIHLGRSVCQVECQEGDRPLTEEKLRQNGIDVAELGRRVLQVVAILAKCDAGAMTVEVDPKPSSSGSLMLNFTRPAMGDTRFRGVGANAFRGGITVTLIGPPEKAPLPNQAGIDWSAFRAAMASLLATLHPPGTRVSIGEPRPSHLNLEDQWHYDLVYSFE